MALMGLLIDKAMLSVSSKIVGGGKPGGGKAD